MGARDSWRMKTALVAGGFLLEIVGLMLVSAEDLAPGVARARAVAASVRERIADNVRRWLGQPAPVRASVSMSDGIAARDRAELIRGVDPDAGGDAILAFLLEEARRTQERLNELGQRLEHEHVRRVSALNILRQEIDEAIGSGIETSRRRFAQLRRYGLVLLFAGSFCLAVANLVE